LFSVALRRGGARPPPRAAAAAAPQRLCLGGAYETLHPFRFFRVSLLDDRFPPGARGLSDRAPLWGRGGPGGSSGSQRKRHAFSFVSARHLDERAPRERRPYPNDGARFE